MAIDHEELPADVLMEVLSRLPVKSLLRFLSVSKHWYALIQNSSFTALHRNRAASISKNTNTDCLLVKPFINCKNPVPRSGPNKAPLKSDNPVMSLVPCETRVGNTDMSFIRFNVKNFRILDISNGLICCCLFLFHHPNRFTLLICNPAMREFRVLPEPLHVTGWTTHLAFGFDPNSNDYKVIRVAKLIAYDKARAGIIDEKVQVYNLSTDSWREVHTVVPKDLRCNVSTSLNGIFYWYATDTLSSNKWIVAFCMREEVFNVMPVPKPVLKSCYEFSTEFCNFCTVKGSLALVTVTWTFSGQCFDVWVIGEFGVMDSWSKIYSIGPFSGGYHFTLGLRQNGELLLERSRALCEDVLHGPLCEDEQQQFVNRCGETRLFSYNLNTHIIKEYAVYGVPFSTSLFPLLQALPYTECLISVRRQ